MGLSGEETQIDQIFFTIKKHSSVKDVRTFRWAKTDSNDYMATIMVCSKQLKNRWTQDSPMPEWRRKPSSRKVKADYAENVTVKLSIKNIENDIDADWNKSKTSVDIVARKAIETIKIFQIA